MVHYPAQHDDDDDDIVGIAHDWYEIGYQIDRRCQVGQQRPAATGLSAGGI